MANQCISLKVDKNLIDSNFDGYKLSLDSVPVYQKTLEFGCEDLPLSERQYSFQHLKAFGNQNLVYGDPWYEDSIYFIDNRWKVMKFSVKAESSLENALPVLQLPGAKERGSIVNRINCSVAFASTKKAVVSDGAGTLILADTFDRTDSLMWKTLGAIRLPESFEEVDDSKGLACRVLNAVEFSKDNLSHIGCLLVHVGEKKKCDDNISEHESSFSTFLHWITLSQDENGDWRIAERRVFEGSVAPDYAVVEPDNEAVRIASAKPFKLIYDSCKSLPQADAESSSQQQDSDDSKDMYVWAQNDEEVSVQFSVSENTSKSDVSFKLTHNNIELHLQGQVLLSGDLCGHVDVDCSTWTLADHVLEILLSKKSDVTWQTVVQGDSRGKFVLDGEQISAMEGIARLGDDKPAYNVQELEECDAYPDEASLMVRFHAVTQRVTHQVNLGSNQWLFNCAAIPGEMPCLCLRHDVDGIVWQPCDITKNSEPWLHVSTFNAFGYVQASKQQRKFSCCSQDFSYAVICDCVRHIYIYRQPSSISTPVRNRKTGREIGSVAKQQLVSLESVEPISGIHATKNRIFALAGETLHVVRMN